MPSSFFNYLWATHSLTCGGIAAVINFSLTTRNGCFLHMVPYSANDFKEVFNNSPQLSKKWSFCCYSRPWQAAILGRTGKTTDFVCSAEYSDYSISTDHRLTSSVAKYPRRPNERPCAHVHVSSQVCAASAVCVCSSLPLSPSPRPRVPH